MRYGIFADIHANLEALEAVLEACRKEGIDRYLCAGDLVGYSANPNECIEKILRISPICVAGNHDRASIDLFPLNYFNRYAKQALLWTKPILKEEMKEFLRNLSLVYENSDLTLVHGTLTKPQDFDYMRDNNAAKIDFLSLKTTVCFLGHTHVPGIFISEEKESLVYYTSDVTIKLSGGCRYIVNVGSVGQPRDLDPRAAYCIYDTEKREIAIKRADYDASITRRKISEAGLPHFLGDRIMAGR